MKTISGALDTHMASEVTTLARFWHITRVDGVQFFFTDHDVAVAYDGNTYIAQSGFSATAIANHAALNVDNLTVEGMFEDSSIRDDEIKAGLFDYAAVELFIGNWADTSQGKLKMRRGWFGEVVSTPSGLYKVELRGMTQVLQQSIVELYGPECRADLGDSRCKVPIDPALRANSTVYATGAFIKVATGGGLNYAVYENRIYKAANGGTTASVAPTFDTTLGNTTLDGYVVATGTLTFTGQPADTETVTINGKVYTFQTVLTNVDGHVFIGASTAISIANLIAAINLGAGSGTAYAAATTLNADVTASTGAGTSMVATAKITGAGGNEISTTEAVVNASWGGAALVGGFTGVTWTATNAWSRDCVVATVTDKSAFTITVTEARATDGWFAGGVIIFDSGSNAGRAFEIKSWLNAGSTVGLFLPTGFNILPGDRAHLYPGCDKRRVTCVTKFINILNMRAEPDLPGRDAALQYPNSH